jgi:preprotein translocase subunit SecD
MRARSLVRLAILVGVAFLVAGCGAASADAGSSPTLQLRLVTSSSQSPCSAAPLTSGGPGTACDRSGNATYELGESLGIVKPTSVAHDNQSPTVLVSLDAADSNTLGDATKAALGKRLAILLDGRVISAPVVKEAITGSQLQLGFDTASEADAIAVALGRPGSS